MLKVGSEAKIVENIYIYTYVYVNKLIRFMSGTSKTLCIECIPHMEQIYIHIFLNCVGLNNQFPINLFSKNNTFSLKS